MPLFRLKARQNLYDTTVSSTSQLDYPKQGGGIWSITEVDRDLLDALNDACNDKRFLAAAGELDARAQDAAMAAILVALAEREVDPAGWGVKVNGSEPVGSTWNDESLKRWIHITKTDGSAEGITAAPYAHPGTPPPISWRVVFIEVVTVTP